MAYGQDTNFVDFLGNPGSGPQQTGPGYLLGRVVSVVYGPNYPGTDIPDPNYQNPTDAGKILFQVINGTQSNSSNSKGNQPARPLFSQIKQYPLEGEYVLILPGPSLELNENADQNNYFYLFPFNLWNATHHNALPNLADYGAHVQSVKRTYEDSQSTNQPSNLTTSSIQYPLASDFPEKSNIKNNLIFTGDVSFEGRWGNSIRFGSSNKANKGRNYWWNGPDGNPITMISNGQGKQIDQEGWIPTVENINTDPASIYLTNGQVITLDDLNNFPLNSFGITISQTATEAIPLNQQVTSIDSISPMMQDQRINNQNPNVVS